ncbi:MAG: hypothetical protein V4555_20550 [Acidobacteriota bacterium]
MLKRWLIGTGILVYLLVCGLIARVLLRQHTSTVTVPSITVGNVTIEVDPHWASRASDSLTSLNRKGFSINPFANSLTLMPIARCADEADVVSRIDRMQDLLEKTQKLIPGSRVNRLELASPAGPITCIENYADLGQPTAISLTCTVHRDGSTFQGSIDSPYIEEALSMIRSTRDTTSCPASTDDAPPATEQK